MYRDSSILPEELASQSVRLKEEQLRREEEKVSDYDILYQGSLSHDGPVASCAKLSSRCNARSMRRGKSCLRRRSRSGEYPARERSGCANVLGLSGTWRADLQLRAPRPNSVTENEFQIKEPYCCGEIYPDFFYVAKATRYYFASSIPLG